MLRTVTVLSIALVGGLAGAGALAGVLELTGGLEGETRTVVQQNPIMRPSADGHSQGLTARDIYKRDAPGVVFIRSQVVQRTDSPFDIFPTEQSGEATGSGFVVNHQGLIVTNAHVIEGASSITVAFGGKRAVPAKLVGKDTSTDLAALRVEADGVNLRPLELGDSRNVQVGDPTIAIGNPFGLDRTLTTGVVSALQRRIQAPNGFEISDVIQTDAAINPGNSGGPLIDAAGRVIGVNSQIATGGQGSQGNVGIGFAVPINTVKRIIPLLERTGKVDRAYLGVNGQPAADGQGVRVVDVVPGSAAEKAGMHGPRQDPSGAPTGGDVITRIGGRQIANADELGRVIAAHRVGDRLQVEVTRNGRPRTVTVQLGARPSQVTPG